MRGSDPAEAASVRPARLVARGALILRAFLRRAAPVVAIAVGASFAVSEARAQTCTPAAPVPGDTVTCTGATSGQNPPNGFGTSAMTGITVNVVPGASVTGIAPAGPATYTDRLS